jgi:hypothetical protein
VPRVLAEITETTASKPKLSKYRVAVTDTGYRVKDIGWNRLIVRQVPTDQWITVEVQLPLSPPAPTRMVETTQTIVCLRPGPIPTPDVPPPPDPGPGPKA